MSQVRHVLIIAACVAAFAQPVHVQDHPDFTGTWRVQRVDTTEARRSNDGGGGRGGRGGFGRRGGGGYPGGNRGGGGRGGGARAGGATLREGDVLKISQTTDRLIITREAPEGAVMTSYTLDGKEAKNHPSPDVEIKSKTHWEGVALVTDSTQTFQSPNGNASMKTREILSLGEDKDSITSTMTADTPFGGKRTITAVLGRVQQ